MQHNITLSLKVAFHGLPEDLLHPPDERLGVGLQLGVLVLQGLAEEGHGVRQHGQVRLALGLDQGGQQGEDKLADLKEYKTSL